MAVLPKKTVSKRQTHRARLVSPLPAKKAAPPPPVILEWDTRGMLRALAAKYPNLDPCLLGWTLLACRMQLAPDETTGNVLAIAEQLVRTNLYNTAAAARARRS